MSKFFVVNVFSFETEMITKILKRNGKEFMIIKERRMSDQADIKIKKAIQNKKEIILVGLEPEKGEWKRCYGDVPMRIIDYKTEDKKERSLIKRIETILKKDVLTDFERVLAAGMENYIPGMADEAERLNMSEKQKNKTIKNIQRGRALFCDGIDRKALEDAEKAIAARKEVGFLTVIEYDYSNNGPVMDLLWNQYEHLLIKNRKEGTAILFTPDYELCKAVQASGGETWTTKREESTKYRLFSNHLAEAEGAVMRYFATR